MGRALEREEVHAFPTIFDSKKLLGTSLHRFHRFHRFVRSTHLHLQHNFPVVELFPLFFRILLFAFMFTFFFIILLLFKVLTILRFRFSYLLQKFNYHYVLAYNFEDFLLGNFGQQFNYIKFRVQKKTETLRKKSETVKDNSIIFV